MASESIETVLPLLKLLANETRLRLIGLVADEAQSVGSLARRLGLTEATISHHLAKLHSADLLSLRAEGTTHYYSLNPDAFAAINRGLLRPERLMRAPVTEGRAPAEARVLRSFVVDGRLVKIPEAHTKREIVLRWVLDQLEDRRYREREISEVLKRYHDDYATLRRELINHRLMKREGGIYWKEPPPGPDEEK